MKEGSLAARMRFELRFQARMSDCIARGLVQQIAYDPESGEAVVTFFGLPRVSIGGMDGTLKSSSSSALMAGAGHLVSKRTVWVRTRRAA